MASAPQETYSENHRISARSDPLEGGEQSTSRVQITPLPVSQCCLPQEAPGPRPMSRSKGNQPSHCWHWLVCTLSIYTCNQSVLHKGLSTVLSLLQDSSAEPPACPQKFPWPAVPTSLSLCVDIVPTQRPCMPPESACTSIPKQAKTTCKGK